MMKKSKIMLNKDEKKVCVAYGENERKNAHTDLFIQWVFKTRRPREMKAKRLCSTNKANVRDCALTHARTQNQMKLTEKIKKINVKLTTTGDGVYNNNKKNTNQINNTLRE